MRTISTAALAVLVIAALFFGNCWTCPEMLAQQAAHGCCKHAKSSCDTQSLRNYVQSDLHIVAVAPAPVATVAPPDSEPLVTPILAAAVVTAIPSLLMPLRV